MSGSGIQTAAAWVWDASWHAAIVAGVVLLIRHLAGRRISPSMRAALWLLVAARLLMFWPPQTDWSLFRVFDLFEKSPRAQIPLQPQAASKGAGPKITIGYGPVEGAALTDAPTPASSTSSKASLLRWAALIWLAGAIFLVARTVSSSLQLRRLVARSTAISDPRLLGLLKQCKIEMKVSRPVVLRSSSGVDGPSLAGAWRPAILLPAGLCEALSSEELRFVFLHELAHVRRHDLLIEWLLAVVAALHWFNPFMWLSAALYRADRELCRDDMVLGLTSAAHRADYGHTLLRLLELLTPRRQSPRLALAMVGQKRNLKERISMIAHLRPTPTRLTVVAIVLVFALLAWIVLTNPRDQKVSDASSHPTTTPEAGVSPATKPQPSFVQKQLDRRLPEVNFSGQALSDVIDFLRDVSGANIFVDWNALEKAGIARSASVTARMRNVSLAKALDVILADVAANKVKLAFAVEDNVITISTAEQLAVTDTRVYDIRDLLVEVPSFDSDKNDPIGGRSGDSRGSTTQPKQTLAQRVAAFIKLIQETVEPQSWQPPFHGAIRETNGQLIVAQTAEGHRALKQLLDQLRETRSIQILSVTQFIVFDPAILPPDDPQWDPIRTASKDEAVNAATRVGMKAPPCLAPAQTAALLAILAKHPDAATRAAPRMTTFNGQRAYVKVATSRAYVSDFKIIRDQQGTTQSYQQVIDNTESGLTLDLQGTASADRKYVTMSIRAKLSKLLNMNSIPFPRLPKDHPANLEKPMIQVPEIKSTQVALTASVPNNQTLVIGLGADTGLLVPETTPFNPKTGNRLFVLVTPSLIHIDTPPVSQEPFPLLKSKPPK